MIKQKDYKNIYVKVRPYVMTYIMKYIVVIINSVILIGLSVLSPLLSGYVITSLYYYDCLKSFKILAFLILTNLFIILFSVCKSKILAYISLNLENVLRQEAFLKITYQPMITYRTNNYGKYMSVITSDISIISNFICSKLITLFSNLLFIIAIGVIIFQSNAILGLIVFAFSLMSYFTFIKYSSKLKRQHKILRLCNDVHISYINQILNAIREVKLLGILNTVNEQYSNKSSKVASERLKLQELTISSQNLLSFISQVEGAIIMVFGIICVIRHSLSVEIFIALLSYTQKFTTSFVNLSTISADYQQFVVSTDRLFNLISSRFEQPSNKLTKGITDGKIEFQNVNFSYDDSEFIKNVSFCALPKQITTIIGKSGSGKTTLINLLCGLYTTKSGKIMIDGIDITEFDHKYLLDNISIVTQQPILFNMSILENIRIVRPKSTYADIVECCKKANIHNFIVKLPEQYNTIVDENCLNLSGGQKQRLSIARALLKNVPILIFDEVTSSLDNETQAYILDSLKLQSKTSTIIMIDHKFAHINNNSQIVFIDSNIHISTGIHKFLMDTDYEYKNLYIKGNCHTNNVQMSI